MLPPSKSPARAVHALRDRIARGAPGRPVLLAALAVLAAGCSAAPASSHSPVAARSAAASPAAPVACKQPPAGSLPGSAGALTQDDSGVFCLAVGRRLDVFLTRSGALAAKPVRWSQIASSDPRVLAPVNSGLLTPPVGVTPGLFRAASAGLARLQSRLPDGKTWQVSIAVR